MSGFLEPVARAGDSVVGLGDVYGQHFDRVVGWFVRRTGDRGLAEDLAQDTFERFAGALDSFDGSRPVWPYLRAVAANVLIDHVRHAERQVVTPSEAVVEGLPGESVVEDSVVTRDLLERGLQALSERQRVAVELQFERDWCVEDAAAFLGMSAGSFRQLSLRARRRLSVWLEQVDDSWRAVVVPVGLGVQARWRSWTSRMRDLATGPAPIVSMDAAASVLVATALGLGAAAGGSTSASLDQLEQVRLTPVAVDVDVMTVAHAPEGGQPAHGTVRASAELKPAPDSAASGNEPPAAPERTVVTAPETPTGGEAQVDAGAEDGRWSLSHEVHAQTGLAPIFSDGDVVSFNCGVDILGPALCGPPEE